MTYSTVLIDPPWEFKTRSDKGKGRSPEKHYPCMTTAEMCAIPLEQLFMPDCAVFIWGTWPKLPDVFTLASAWGLQYVTTAFIWAKTNKVGEGFVLSLDDNANWFMGLGYITRANTEPCFLFRRGRPKRQSKNVRQLIVARRRRHSEKPPQIYTNIEALYPAPYCEVFARQPRPGWHSIGNEIDGKDIRGVLENV